MHYLYVGVVCPVPPEIPNLNHTRSIVAAKSHYRFGDTMTYFCIAGYEPTLDPTIICQFNREWTVVPACVRKYFCSSVIKFPSPLLQVWFLLIWRPELSRRLV